MKKISLICLATLMAFQSCKKTETLTSEDKEIVEDNAHSEQISEDASKITDDAYYASTNILVRDNSSASTVLADTVKITKNAADDSYLLCLCRAAWRSACMARIWLPSAA